MNNIPMEATVGLIKLRDQRIHISTLMLLSIVDRLTIKKADDWAYIGEVEALYLEVHREYKTRSSSGYTYAGIATMLRKMHSKLGLLNYQKDGRFVKYRLSAGGRNMLDNLTL